MPDEIKPGTTENAITEAKKRRGGRKPMTAEEKETAAQARAAEKAQADNLKPAYVLHIRRQRFLSTLWQR